MRLIPPEVMGFLPTPYLWMSSYMIAAHQNIWLYEAPQGVGLYPLKQTHGHYRWKMTTRLV